MAEKWILVAPWGDPSGWRPVAYRIPKIWEKCRDLWGETQEYVCKEDAISSTAAIAKCIWSGRHVQGVDLKVVVIASETLTQQGDGCREDIASIKDIAREYVKRYVREFFQGEEDRVKVFIAPGIAFIQRQRTLEFRCSVENYATVVFSHLLKVFTDEEPTTLIIDITHGINYMPYIAARAAERAFEAYVMDKILGKDEKDADSSYRILVVNSDPYTPYTGGKTRQLC